MLVILCFITIDLMAAGRALREAAIQAVHPGARVVFRRGDCFTGWVERSLNDKPIGAVDATGFPVVAAAFEAAGIPSVQFPVTPPLPGPDLVPTDQTPPPEGSKPPLPPKGKK